MSLFLNPPYAFQHDILGSLKQFCRDWKDVENVEKTLTTGNDDEESVAFDNPDIASDIASNVPVVASDDPYNSYFPSMPASSNEGTGEEIEDEDTREEIEDEVHATIMNLNVNFDAEDQQIADDLMTAKGVGKQNKKQK